MKHGDVAPHESSNMRIACYGSLEFSAIHHSGPRSLLHAAQMKDACNEVRRNAANSWGSTKYGDGRS